MSYQRHNIHWYEEYLDKDGSSVISVSSIQLILYVLLLLVGAYCIVQRSDYLSLLPLQELLWNVLVYVTPSSLVMALDKKSTSSTRDGTNDWTYADSRTFAAKCDAMRRILGLDGSGMLTKLQHIQTFSGVGLLLKSQPPSYAPPGLGNWDNSCYQNSVIQGLAALPAVSLFLRSAAAGQSLEKDGEDDRDTEMSIRTALRGVIEQLNDPANAGRRLWTPAALKSMSSWQQQDAQEYFSKICDDMEKEMAKGLRNNRRHEGLRMLKNLEGKQRTAPRKEMEIEQELGVTGTQDQRFKSEVEVATLSSPWEGLLAQRVGCLQCGYVEGLSLIPFNCITLPLGRAWSYAVADCLDDYTQLERIDEVECGKCTLLQQQEQLSKLLAGEAKPGLEHLFECATKRLGAVKQALEDNDFSEAILKNLQIPSKNRVSSSKTRQAVVARVPESLVLHVNRSLFDEKTGVLSKNPAGVSFSEVLDLGAWCLGKHGMEAKQALEAWSTDPNVSLLACGSDSRTNDQILSNSRQYVLRAVITHYGRHENGHYICYRRDPSNEEQWWRFSDEDVSMVSQDNVLSQGEVFMLFYTRVYRPQPTGLDRELKATATTIPAEAGTEVILEPLTEAEATDANDSLENVPPQGAIGQSTLAFEEPQSAIPAFPLTHDYETSEQQVGGDPAHNGVDKISLTLEEAPSEAKPVAPPMRTAGAKSKGRRKTGQHSLSNVSNMVAAN